MSKSHFTLTLPTAGFDGMAERHQIFRLPKKPPVSIDAWVVFAKNTPLRIIGAMGGEIYLKRGEAMEFARVRFSNRIAWRARARWTL